MKITAAMWKKRYEDLKRKSTAEIRSLQAEVEEKHGEINVQATRLNDASKQLVEKEGAIENLRKTVDWMKAQINEPNPRLVPAPIPMLLWCPECHERHIDRGEYATRAHRTHACQHCGHVWRPAVVQTVGVQFLPSFKDA